MLKGLKKGALTLTTVFLAAVAMAKPVSSNGLVLWFRNGPDTLKLRDASPQKNNGTATSVIVSNSPSLVSMQTTRQLTLAAWIKPNSVGFEFPVIIAKGGNNGPNAYGGYELVLNSNGDNDVIFASGAFYADTHAANGSLINHHLGEWIHVAVTIDAVNQTLQFYIDGVPYSNVYTSGAFSAINFDLPNNLYVGAPDPGSDSDFASFDGTIRQVRVYNRTLSADEIQKIFSSGQPKK